METERERIAEALNEWGTAYIKRRHGMDAIISRDVYMYYAALAKRIEAALRAVVDEARRSHRFCRACPQGAPYCG